MIPQQEDLAKPKLKKGLRALMNPQQEEDLKKNFEYYFYSEADEPGIEKSDLT